MRNTDEEVRTNSCDILLWTPAHGRASVGRPARTYLHQLCADRWKERIREIRAISTTWWCPYSIFKLKTAVPTGVLKLSSDESVQYLNGLSIRNRRYRWPCRRSKDELMSDVFLWNSTHGNTSVGQPGLLQLCPAYFARLTWLVC